MSLAASRFSLKKRNPRLADPASTDHRIYCTLRVDEDLAVTSGAVAYHLYRDAVCEVIQSVVAY